MKFFLVRKAYFSGVKGHFTSVFPFVTKVNSDYIQPAEDSLADSEPCTNLRQHLQTAGPSASLLTCEWTFASGTTSTSFRVLSSPLTNSLLELFGEDVEMQVTISNLKTNQTYKNCPERLESTEMKITSGQDFAFQDMDLIVGSCFADHLLSKFGNLEISGDLTVTVTVGTLPGPVVPDKMQVNRKMLQEELGSDLVIIADNGKQVKAHKCVLMSHSSVFNAMFQSDMQETKTNTLEMADMSEEGVRGLLAYLYCWEEEEPNAKPQVAFEMLQAGHKYDIPVLQTAMKKLLLGKPNKWFDAEVALKLFFFGKKLPEEDGNSLKMKALRVMKGNFGDFKGSETIITLFREDPETALELSAYFAA